MKSVNLAPLVMLFITLFSYITAHPTTDSTAVQSANTNLPVRDLQPVTTQDILNLASDLFAVQLAGTKSQLQQLTELCVKFDPTRLQAQGYNISAIHNIFCEAGWATFLNGGGYNVIPSSYTRDTAINLSSYIWIFQAVGALKNNKGRLKQLCELIDVESSFNVGHNGTLVKISICDAADGIGLPSVPSLPVPFQDVRKSLQEGKPNATALNPKTWTTKH
ncbi:MAG: hypothetical protein Q9172_000836 [Xanthocarpia lactea]